MNTNNYEFDREFNDTYVLRLWFKSSNEVNEGRHQVPWRMNTECSHKRWFLCTSVGYPRKPNLWWVRTPSSTALETSQRSKPPTPWALSRLPPLYAPRSSICHLISTETLTKIRIWSRFWKSRTNVTITKLSYRTPKIISALIECFIGSKFIWPENVVYKSVTMSL